MAWPALADQRSLILYYSNIMVCQAAAAWLAAPMLALKLPKEILRADQVIVENPPRDGEEIANERISHGVAHADALFAASHDVGGAQNGKLLGDHRLIDPEGFLQFLNAFLPFDQELEDPNANGMGQSPEERSLERLQFVGGDFIHISGFYKRGPTKA